MSFEHIKSDVVGVFDLTDNKGPSFEHSPPAIRVVLGHTLTLSLGVDDIDEFSVRLDTNIQDKYTFGELHLPLLSPLWKLTMVYDGKSWYGKLWCTKLCQVLGNVWYTMVLYHGISWCNFIRDISSFFLQFKLFLTAKITCETFELQTQGTEFCSLFKTVCISACALEIVETFKNLINECGSIDPYLSMTF